MGQYAFIVGSRLTYRIHYYTLERWFLCTNDISISLMYDRLSCTPEPVPLLRPILNYELCHQYVKNEGKIQAFMVHYVWTSLTLEIFLSQIPICNFQKYLMFIVFKDLIFLLEAMT